MSEQVPRPEKTEAQVAGQIERIAGKLHERAEGMSEAIESTNTKENYLGVEPYSPTSSGTIEHSVIPSIHDSSTITRMSHYGSSGNTLSKESFGKDIGDNKTVKVMSHRGEVIGKVSGDGVGGFLSKDQITHASANILSKTRGELARRKIEHDKSKQDQIDKILSA